MKRALVLAVVVLAGCGGSSSPSKDDFKKDYAPVDAQLKAAGREMATVLQNASSKTDVVLAGEIDRVSSQLDDVTSKMADIKPPDELKDDYKALRDTLDGIESDLTDLSSSVSSHDAPSAGTGTRKLIVDSAKVRTTANKVRRAVGLKPS